MVASKRSSMSASSSQGERYAGPGQAAYEGVCLLSELDIWGKSDQSGLSS